MKMKVLLTAIALFGMSEISSAQRGYTEQTRRDGLTISTKWGKAKDETGTKRSALLISVVNNEKKAREYSFDILFYYEGILRETGVIETNCIDGLKSKVGRLSGTYFIPSKLSDEQLQAPDFGFEIDGVTVKQVEACVQE
jgi:hypothetical protein